MRLDLSAFYRRRRARQARNQRDARTISLVGRSAATRDRKIAALKIPAVLLFGVLEASSKDEIGSASWNDHGIVPKAIRAIKRTAPELVAPNELRDDAPRSRRIRAPSQRADRKVNPQGHSEKQSHRKVRLFFARGESD
jgi:hypothetical protein